MTALRYPMACDDMTLASFIQCSVLLDLVRDTPVSHGSNIWRTSYYKQCFEPEDDEHSLLKWHQVLTHWVPCCHAKGLAQNGMQCAVRLLLPLTAQGYLPLSFGSLLSRMVQKTFPLLSIAHPQVNLVEPINQACHARTKAGHCLAKGFPGSCVLEELLWRILACSSPPTLQHDDNSPQWGSLFCAPGAGSSPSNHKPSHRVNGAERELDCCI